MKRENNKKSKQARADHHRNMVTAIENFITQKLINDCKPVTFLDLCDEFSINVNKAKNEMVQYYSTTRHESIQCIVVCVLKHNVIQMITDPEKLPEKEDIKDFFIYAFNPLETIDLTNRERTHVTIKNPYKLHNQNGTRPQTSDGIGSVINITTQDVTQKMVAGPKKKSEAEPVVTKQRAKTFPEVAVTKPKKPTKSMGLKSTELLARMRREREEKEKNRQEELERRKHQQQDKNHVVVSQEKQKQLDQLASMFDDDDDDDLAQFDKNSKKRDKKEESEEEAEVNHPVAIESVPSQESQPVNLDRTVTNLEELLDTTVDESLMELSQPEKEKEKEKEEPVHESKEQTTYIDKDGYMVTKRPATETKKPPKPVKSAKTAEPSKKPATPVEKKKARSSQRTLESFFGKKKG